MSDERRGPNLGVIVGLLLLAGSIGFSAWWFNRPPKEPATLPNPDTMDVVCTGRVDAAGMVIPLEPTQAGRVVRINVKEGDAVMKGQEVLHLDDDAAQVRLAQAEATVEAAKVELDAATKDAERFPNQIAARGHLLLAAKARVEAAQKMLQQRREQQTITPLGRAEQEALEAQVQELVQLELAERGQNEDLKKLNPELRVRLARSRLKAAEADQKLAEKAVQEAAILAPANGTILRLQATVGGMLAPGLPTPAVVFAPAGPMVIRAEVDQEFLGRVKPGMKALIQDENRVDGPTWTGKVRSVAGWVAMRRAFLLDPGEINDVRTVECVVEFDSPTTDVWIGQRMRVRIGPGK